MARVQLKGVNSITVWMIVFVSLWLTSTVLLVIMYTQQEELSDQAAKVQQDNERLITGTERRSVELFQRAQPGGPTVVGLLEGARAETAELATGEPGDSPAAVRTKLDEFLAAIRSDDIVPKPRSYQDVSYQDALTMLYESFRADHVVRLQASSRVEELEGEVDRLVKANAEQQSSFDKRTRELGDQFAEAEADRQTKLKERDEAVEALARRFDEQRTLTEADLTRVRQENAALTEQIDGLRERFAAFQSKFGELLIGPEELATARKPDGRILTAVPGDNVVYIDLGRDDMLTLGLKFAVYPADAGITAEGGSKAQIEVVSIAEQSAECRIVSVANAQVILPNDLIANPIYDRDRQLTFVVLGEFDLNHDGVLDPGGAAFVGSMIINWGGLLSDELTALTDFAIVGRAPRRPRSNADTSPERAERARTMQEAFDRYNTVLASAQSLSVPILTQEVFLNFLGYSARYGRR